MAKKVQSLPSKLFQVIGLPITFEVCIIQDPVSCIFLKYQCLYKEESTWFILFLPKIRKIIITKPS